MGIKLDWEVETERSYEQNAKEDRFSVRRRWLARLRILLGAAVLIAILGVLAGLVWWRLQVVDGEIRRSLTDTVGAEVTALRIADRPAYLGVQRSADEVWLNIQANRFENYQNLKTNYDVQLTGDILDVTLDGARGRVQVQEIIDGVPYVQTWFYWRYSDQGWRHVAPDYTFWGEERTQTADNLTVEYNALDEPLAQAFVAQADGWVSRGCAVLGCATTPRVTIEIVAREGIEANWSESDPWRLIVPSVYVSRARYDRPLDADLRTRVAELIVSRLASQSANVTAVTYPTDAFFLRESVQAWLVGAFAETDAGSYLIDSYVSRYGEAAAQSVLANLQPDSDLSLLAAAAGVSSLDALEVDWRDYLTWRLSVEADLNTQRDQVRFNALYDMNDPTAADAALMRFNQPPPADGRQVVGVQSGQDAQGVPILQTTVRAGEGENVRDISVIFRRVDGQWKRIN